jgi:hypothetical protein
MSTRWTDIRQEGRRANLVDKVPRLEAATQRQVMDIPESIFRGRRLHSVSPYKQPLPGCTIGKCVTSLSFFTRFVPRQQYGAFGHLAANRHSFCRYRPEGRGNERTPCSSACRRLL